MTLLRPAFAILLPLFGSMRRPPRCPKHRKKSPDPDIEAQGSCVVEPI